VERDASPERDAPQKRDAAAAERGLQTFVKEPTTAGEGERSYFTASQLAEAHPSHLMVGNASSESPTKLPAPQTDNGDEPPFSNIKQFEGDLSNVVRRSTRERKETQFLRF